MNPGPRISKDPEVRKEELIDAAEALFEEKGYDDTAVSDIVRKVGVAQGTFYLYFRSKDEVLEASANRLADEYLVRLRTIKDDPDIDALEKLVAMTKASISLPAGRERTTVLIHDEKYAPLHSRIEKMMVPQLIDIMADIIAQGNREGLFDVEHHREAGIAILGISHFIGESTASSSKGWTMDEIELGRIVSIIERILGMKKGAFMNRIKEMVR